MKRNPERMVVEFRAPNEPVRVGFAVADAEGGWMVVFDGIPTPQRTLRIAPPGAVAWQKQQKTSRGRWLTEDEAREAPSDLVVWP